MATATAPARASAFRKSGRKRKGSDEQEANELLLGTRTTPERSSNREREFFAGSSSFADIGANGSVAQSLRSLGFKAPSHIQALSYRHLLEHNTLQTLLLAQAGSGKTIAYLAPLLQQLKEHEELHGRSSLPHPSVLVIVPTEELANMVLGVCRSLAKTGLKHRSVAITGATDYDTGNTRFKTQVEFMREDTLDVVVATPGRLMSLVAMGLFDMRSLNAVVLDEVDILASEQRGFKQQLEELCEEIPSSTQLVLATATMHRDELPAVQRMLPSPMDCKKLKVLTGPNLHKPAPGVQHNVIDCTSDSGGSPTVAESSSEDDNGPWGAVDLKLSRLEQVLRRSRSKTTVVFCNTIDTCRRVENRLRKGDRKERGRIVRAVHQALRADSRQANIALLCGAGDDAHMDNRERVFVVTPRASAGLDMRVDHVILFDFPEQPSEFIRRAGRAARGTRKAARVSSLAVGEEVALARQVMKTSTARNSPLMQTP